MYRLGFNLRANNTDDKEAIDLSWNFGRRTQKEKDNGATYVPHPFETQSIPFPDNLRELVDDVACTTHDAWAEAKIKDGWVFGSSNNEAKKTHHLLIPYEFLPKVDKERNRAAVVQMIKSCIFL